MVGEIRCGMRRYAEAYALNSAGVVDDRTIFDAARIDRRTAVAYEHLLTNLLLVEAVPAWSSSRLKRARAERPSDTWSIRR